MAFLELSGLIYPAIGAAGALAAAGAAIGVKYMIRLGQFSYQNARLSTIGNPYVLKEELIPLAESTGAEGLSRSIQGTFAFSEPPASFREADHRLMDSFDREMGSLLRDSPGSADSTIRLLMLRYESMEIKRLLRSLGKASEPIHPIGSIGADLERQILGSGSLSQAVECLEYHPLGRGLAPLVRSGDGSLSSIDLALDRAAIELINDAEGIPRAARKGISNIGGVLADAYNINLLLRSKGAFLDREKALNQMVRGGTIGQARLEGMAEAVTLHEAVQALSGTLPEEHLKRSEVSGKINMNAAMDRMLLEGAVKIGHRYFSGIGPTIRYIFSLEMEMRNLRTLFLAAFYRWDRDRTVGNLVVQEENA